MNESEIARIVGGRSNWETLKAAANKWQLDPKAALSITPAQRQQIRALVSTVADKITAQQQVLDQAYEDLNGTDDPKQHRQIVTKARKALTQAATGVSGQQQTGQLPQQARSQLKEGIETTFKNGQTWTLRNGQPVQVK